MPITFSRVNQWGDPTDCLPDTCLYCYQDPDETPFPQREIRNRLDSENGEGEDVSFLNADMNDDCPACRLKAGVDTSLRVSRIHDYSSEIPGGWTPKSVAGDQHRWYMGVELETVYEGLSDYGDPDSRIHARVANMRRPLSHWHAKRDGSVSGPEFASNPATMSWWREHLDDMSEMFRLLLHAGLRSYDGGQAGMHVNISRSAFTNAEHLFRFAHLVCISPSWSTIMSQRTPEQVDHWARFDYVGTSVRQIRQWAEENILHGYGEKYSVLHPTGPRIEFRLPRGTLRVDRFFKNLEWVTAMIEYTRRDNSVPKPIDFMNDVAKSSASRVQFPNLNAFLNERSSALISASK